MDRQRFIEDISLIEEQAERAAATQFFKESGTEISSDISPALTSASILEISEAVDTLQKRISDQRLQRSISAESFLKKVSKVIVLECASQPRPISISIRGEGVISIELAELAMTTILHTIRASVISALGLSDSDRYQKNLFPIASFQLFLHSDPEQIVFSLTDDGNGIPANDIAINEQREELKKLRWVLADTGGWFRQKKLGDYGSVIEFRLPFVEGRFSSVLVTSNGVEALIPTHLVSDILDEVPPFSEGKLVVARLDPNLGMIRSGDGDENGLLELSIADQKIFLSCDILETEIKVRKIDGKDFFQEDSCIQCFGSFLEGKSPRLLPLLDGKNILKFLLENTELANESS